MQRFSGLFGIAAIFAIAFLMSNNRRRINYRVIIVGFLLQISLAFFILKVPAGQYIFAHLGSFITRLLNFADKAGDFVFGVLSNGKKLEQVFGPGSGFIFYFKII